MKMGVCARMLAVVAAATLVPLAACTTHGPAQSSGDATGSVGDATGSVGDATGSVGDATSPAGDATGSAGDAATSADAANGPLVDAAPAFCGARAKVGTYCGGDRVPNGDPSTLYTCNGPGAPTAQKYCRRGCIVVAGPNDYCRPPYRLPWTHGVTMKLTQDCNDPCCNDHVGPDKYAWDWANGNNFVVRAARGGTITHMKLSSSTGGSTSFYSDYVNMIVVDHGNGTQTIYMHLKYNSAKSGIRCGAHVDQGQALAVSGDTGHSTAVHLHFQVSKVHPNVPKCECGADGLHCAANWNPFPNVWVSSTYPTVPIRFEEWPVASQCADRRITMPNSLN